jgi:hypothetical protein
VVQLGRLLLQVGEGGQLGQVLPAVRQLRESGVGRLQVEQSELGGGVGVQEGLASSDGACRVQGSVT